MEREVLSGEMGGKSVVALILACAVGLLVACGGGGGGGGGGVDSQQNANQPPPTDQPSSTNTNQLPPTDQPSSTNTNQLPPTDQPSSTNTNQLPPTDQPSSTNTNQPPPTDQPSSTNTNQPPPTDQPPNTGQPPSTEQPPKPNLPPPSSPSFTSYLSDAAVTGVEYSGSAGNGVTGEGGVFTVGVGAVRFFIGSTTLGSVQINENWDNAHLTPADFMGVDMAGVISITRILQGLDEDGNLQNGISISQTARSGAQNLFDDLTESGTIAVISGKTYSIPSANEAMRHFVSTRRCIFSGVYVGGYQATVGSDIRDERPGYFIFEPFANRARGEFSAGNDFELMSVAITVGETRSVVTLSAGNELDFVTPRLVTGIWSSGTVSGTNRFTLLAGDPTATLRIVGIEIDERRTVSGLYALDYLDSDGGFRGQYYDVETDKISVLSYELQGGAWPAAMMTANLTLRGNDVITLEFVRKDDNYGEFEGIGDYDGLSGTWCDFGGSGKPVAPIAPVAPVTPITPATPIAATQSDSAISITWSAVADAAHYKLYRSETSGGSFAQIGGDITGTDYVDDGDLAANTAYYYQLESCNDNGCSDRSREVSATTAPATPLEPTAATQSDDAISITWSAVADAAHYKLYRATVSGGLLMPIGGEIATTEYVDSGLDANTSYYYRLESCNDNGCSGRSPEVSAMTYPAAPDAPEIPTADTQSDSEIEISWSEVARAMHYKLYRSTVSGGSYSQTGGDIAATRYRDSALSVKTAYYYQLEACNSGGCSGRSPEVAASTYGSLGEPRDEIRTGLADPRAIAFSGGRAYVMDSEIDKIISYPVEDGGGLGAGRDEITTGLFVPRAIAFSGGRAYVADFIKNKIISYAVEEGGNLGAGRDEITSGLSFPSAIAFSGERVYVAAGTFPGEIISYAVEEGGSLGAARDEITTDLPLPSAIAFSGGRAYVTDANLDKIISYPEGVNGSLGAGRDEITTGLSFPSAIAFSGGRAYVADIDLAKIISYAVEEDGSLGAGRDEITTGLDQPFAVAFSGERVYVADIDLAKIISYPLFSPVSFAVAPDAPRVVAQSDSEIEIAWNAVLGATHYKLYRSATSGGLFAPVGGEISVTRYLDDDFSGDAFYYYQLEACSGGECSERSPAIGAVPAMPSPTAAAQSDSAISIRWSNAAGATHYKLYRSETSEGSFTQIGGNITATDYIDNNDLAANTPYYYRVESCNDNGCSGRSPEVSATTAPAIPSTPATPTASAQSESAISISWSAVAGATHYKLYRSETSGGSFDQIGGDIAAIDYVDASDLAANTSYYYQLESCNDNGCSSRSSVVSATTAPETPETPTTATQSEGAISISWSAVAGATHYKLYRSETSEGLFAQIGGDIAVTDYVDASDLAANTSYYYQLESCNDNGCSSRSSVVSATTAPETPETPTVTAQSEGAVSIGWSAVAGATHYKLYRSETSGGSFAQIGGDITGTDYVDASGLAASTSYYYQLESCNGNGCSSRSSAVSATTAPERPETPTTATQSEGAISISWSAVAGATHYKLYRSATSEGSFAQIGREITATDYVDNSGLAANTSYYYQLESCNGNGCSSRSSAVSATTTPERPSALTVAAQSEGAVSISWSAVAGATHYKLYRSATSEGSFTQIGGEIAGTDYVDDNDLAANTSYYYQLAACSGNGCSSRSSAVSATTAPETPETLTAAAQSKSAISISWSAVAGATHYKLYRSETRDGSFMQIGGEITATDYVDSDISAGASYYYQLEACNDNGCSGRSLEVSTAIYGSLGEPRDEVVSGLGEPFLIALSSKRAYVADNRFNEFHVIISYPVEANGILGEARNEITVDFVGASAFSGGRLYLGEEIREEGFIGKIISYPVGADGVLGAARDEITTGLNGPSALAFSGERAYVVDFLFNKITSYPVGADGELGAARDEITTGLESPRALAFSGGRAYVTDIDNFSNEDKIISYAVGADGILGAGRDEITTGLTGTTPLAFSGGRVYVLDGDVLDGGGKIISYAVGADGSLGESRDETTTDLSSPYALAFLGGRVYAVIFTGQVISYPLLSPVPFAVAPDAPRVFAQSDSEIEIAWNMVLGATHYKLYRSETSGGLFALVGGDISVTRYRDSDPANTFYYYQLEACSGDECSGRSPAVGTAPAMPSPMVATQSDSAISITWSAVVGATHYKLYRATVSGGSLTPIGGKIAATEYIDGNLDANTSYYYRLESCNDNGCSGRSLEVSAATAPATPSAPAMPLVAAQSDVAIAITWSAVVGATHYKLYRATVSGGSLTPIGGEITATEYVDGGLDANTSYYYQLESCNDNGCSDRSLEISATTAPATPLKPMAAAQSDDAISITWSAVVGATHYKLYRATVSGGSLTPIGGEIAATEYVDSGLDANTSYYYQLESCNDNGCSDRSLEVSATTAPATPLKPTAAAQSDVAIAITWSAVAGATHYKLYRATVSGGSLTPIGGEIAATEYVDGGLDANTSYYYRLESCNDNGCSDRSLEVSATTALAMPLKPTAAAQSDVAIAITWGGVADATHYKLYRATVSGGSLTPIGGEIAATEYVDSGLDANTSYYYQLESCNDNGCSDRSLEVSATTAPATPLKPTAAAQSDVAIAITWSAVAGATHYKLYRATVSGGSLTPIGGEIAATEYVDSGLDANTSYYYRLESCNDNGCSGRSLEVSVTTAPAITPPATPLKPMAVTQSDVAIAITWSAIAGATHYKLYRATVSGGALTPIGGEIAATEYVDSNLDANTSYYYRLESCNDNGCSDRSLEISATTAPATPLKPTAAAQSDVAIAITWSAIAGATHYKLYRATVSGGSLTPIGGEIAATEYVDGNLDANTFYYYQLESCNDNGCSDRSLEVSATTAPATPLKPTAAAQSDDAISIAWSAVAGAAHYKLYRATVSGGSLTPIGGEIAATEYVDSNLDANTSYYYRLKSCNDNGCSGRSSEVSAATTGPLGATRDEITVGLDFPFGIAFSSGRAYVVDIDLDKIISYAVGVDGTLGVARDEITIDSPDSYPLGVAFSGGRAYVVDIGSNKIISYAVGADGTLGAARDEITVGLPKPNGIAFSGGRAYVVDIDLAKIISYAVGADGKLGAARDEITADLSGPLGIAFSAGRAYVADFRKIISYAVGVGGRLGAARDEITVGLSDSNGIAFFGGRAYVVDIDRGKIISYAVGADGKLGAARDEIMAGLHQPLGIAFSGRRAYVTDRSLAKIISYPLTPISPPVAPDAPRVAAQSDSEIEIAWNAVSGAMYYKLYRATIRGGLFTQVGGEISVTRYLNDGLTDAFSANTLYYYQLEACNGVGCSERSPDGSIAPAAPIAATQSESGISITWSAVAGARYYKLYRLGSDGSYAQIGGEIAATGYLDSNLSANTSYYYQLEVCNSAGCSARSLEVLAATYGSLGAARDEVTVGLDFPLALAFSGGRAYVVAAVSGNDDKIISYAVEADGRLGAARDEIAAGLSEPFAIAFSGGRVYVTDRGLDKIISYAVGAGGTLGAVRDEITVGLFDSYLTDIAFSGERAYVADYSRNRIISYAVGADGRLGAARDEITVGLSNPFAIAFSGERAYVTDDGIDKIISYAVEAGGRLGAARDEITTDLDTPLDIAFSGERVYVTDFSLAKIVSYAAGVGGKLGAARDEITAGLLEPIAIVFSGGRAYVTDRGIDKIISYPLIQISPPAAPDAPRVAAQSDSEIEIAWNAVSGATHYKLYRATTRGGSYTQVGGEISVTRYLNGDLADAFSASASYYYQLEACNGAGCSERSPDGGLVALATLTAVTQSDSEISISWSAVADATHYNLYRSTSGGSYTQIGGKITATSYLDSGLSVKIAYYYQLEVCNSVGCSRRSFEVSATTYGSLGAARDETAGLSDPIAIAFSGRRAYVARSFLNAFYGLISYAVGADGRLGAERDERTNLGRPAAIAFSGGRVYVVDYRYNKIASYAVGADRILSAERDEITVGLNVPRAIAFSGKRAYVTNFDSNKIISYAVGANGRLGAARDEITAGLSDPIAIAFSGGRAYVVDAVFSSGLDKIISYAVGADGRLGVARDEITTGLRQPTAIAFSGGRAYVVDATLDKIISYAVEADGRLGAARDEVTAGLNIPTAIAFSGGRAYVTDDGLDKIISYPLTQVSSPVAPDAPRVVAQSDSEIEVTWNAVSGATHYKLYRAATRGGLFTQIGGEISVTRYLNDGFSDAFSANTLYYYQLESCNGAGCSGRSPDGSMALATPVAAAQSESEILISWSAVAGARYYKLYRLGSDGSYIQVGGEIAANSYLDSNLSANTSYYYQLEVCNSDECSARSFEVLAATTGPLGATGDRITVGLSNPLAIAFSDGRAYVTDDGLDKIMSHAVGADGSLGAAGDEITVGLSDPTAIAFSGGRAYVTDKGLDKIISYAVGANGILGAARDEITAGLSDPTAIAFSGGRAYVTDKGLDKIISYAVGANGILGAARDEITAGLSDPTAIAFSGGRAYVTDKGLDKIISYAVGANGILGAARDEITAGLSDPTAIAFSGGRAYVTDKGLDKIISYAVGADGSLGAARDEITAGLSDPTAIAFSGGRAYVTDFGKIVSFSLIQISLPVAPDAPRVAAQNGGDIEIAWNAVLGVTHYKLYRATTRGGLYAQVGGEIFVTRYRDDALSESASYYYQLESCNSFGCSRRSPDGSATTAPAAPTAVVQNESEILISWSAVAEARYYKLYRSTTSGSLYMQIGGDIDATSYLDSDLFANTLYYYQLEACNSVECSARSLESSAATYGLGAARSEITTGLGDPLVIAFSGGRAYMADFNPARIISYAVGADGKLSAARDEITAGLSGPYGIAFSGGRAYVTDINLDKIISYAVGADGRLGAARDEITAGLNLSYGIAFSGGRVYVTDFLRRGKIISYAVGVDGILGAARDEEATLRFLPRSIAFSGGRAYVTGSHSRIKIISYAVGVDGKLSVEREEIRDDLDTPNAIAFSGERAYVADLNLAKIISYAVGADGELDAANDETRTDLSHPRAIAFSGERAYVTDVDKIVSYPLIRISPPVAPDAPRVVAQNDSEIEIAWNAVSGATHYKIYRATTRDGSYDQIGGEISVTRYRDSELSANASYYYQLEACSGDECSGRSPDGSATTAPVALTVATQSDNAISITWRAVADATHYKLYRSTTRDGSYMQIGGDIDATGYLDSNLFANTSYYYQLEACNSDGCSGRSFAVSVATTGPLHAARDEVTAGLSNPFAIAFSGGRIYAVDYVLNKIISYAVGTGGRLGAARDEITAGLSNPIGIAFSGGRAYVTDIDSNKIISYAVRADGRLGAARDEITAGLSAPLAIAFSGGRAYVTDQSLHKIISYAVGTDGKLSAARDEITAGLPNPLAIAFSGGRAYVTDQTINKVISYAVGADGRLGAARDEITTGLSLSFAIAFSGGRAYVTDVESDKIISYAVGADGKLGAARDEITVGLSAPRGIAFSGERAYVVDESLDKIISYSLIQISPPVAPDAPRVAAQNGSEIEIAWNAVSGAAHYKLYRATTRGGLFTQVGGEIYVTRYRDSALSANASYYYQLEACNSGGCSGRSLDGSATTAPAAPTVEAQSESEILISWSAVAGATHYKLYQSTRSGDLYMRIGGDIDATSYLDSNLFGNTSYYYQLEACNSGGCSVRSREVSAVTYGSFGAARDEVTADLPNPLVIAFSGGRAYVSDFSLAKIISYAMGADGKLSAARDEITAGLSGPYGIAFSGGRAYVTDLNLDKIISYAVGADGGLGSARDEITAGLDRPYAIAFLGGRAYVTDVESDKIISYAVGADGILGAARDEITVGLDIPTAIAFSGERAYVADSRRAKIISYAVGAGGKLSVARDEITVGLLEPNAIVFSDGRAYVVDLDFAKIISYTVGTGGKLGAARDETTNLPNPRVIAFSGGRAYVTAIGKIISYPLIRISPPVAPDAPRVAAQNDSEIEIAWNAVSGATHYKLYRSETSGGLFASVGGGISVTRYRDSELSANTFYYYQLEACSGDECSGRSPEVSATIAPATPGATAAATQSDSAISITWSEVVEARRHKLYRSRNTSRFRAGGYPVE